MDSFCYFLLCEILFGVDGYFLEEVLKNRYNSDFVNDFGNLLLRIVVMIEKYFDGVIYFFEEKEEIDNELKDFVKEVYENVCKLFDEF